MKHLSFLRRHANIVFCLLLCLVYQRAESKELFENNSLDTCYVLAIANVDLTTDLQKKYIFYVDSYNTFPVLAEPYKGYC